MNCSVVPRAILGFAGVTAMETRVAAVTVSSAVTDTVPIAAVIVTDPVPTPTASPLEPDALLTEAMV